jgi:hypothetical protein
MERKKEDTDGELDVYCVRKRFSFCVSRVRKFGRRSVGVCARSTRLCGGDDGTKAKRRRRKRKNAPFFREKKRLFFRVPWT